MGKKTKKNPIRQWVKGGGELPHEQQGHSGVGVEEGLADPPSPAMGPPPCLPTPEDTSSSRQR